MTRLEKRLEKLEEEISQLQGKAHYVFSEDGENYELPPDFAEGDHLVIIRWLRPDEAIPNREEQEHDA